MTNKVDSKKKTYKVTVHLDNGTRDTVTIQAERMDIDSKGVLSFSNYEEYEVEDNTTPRLPATKVKMAESIALFAAGSWVMAREEG